MVIFRNVHIDRRAVVLFSDFTEKQIRRKLYTAFFERLINGENVRIYHPANPNNFVVLTPKRFVEFLQKRLRKKPSNFEDLALQLGIQPRKGYLRGRLSVLAQPYLSVEHFVETLVQSIAKRTFKKVPTVWINDTKVKNSLPFILGNFGNEFPKSKSEPRELVEEFFELVYHNLRVPDDCWKDAVRILKEEIQKGSAGFCYAIPKEVLLSYADEIELPAGRVYGILHLVEKFGKNTDGGLA